MKIATPLSSFFSTRSNMSSNSTDQPMKSTSLSSNTMMLVTCMRRWTNPKCLLQTSNRPELRNSSNHNYTIRSVPKYAATLTKGRGQGFEIDDNGPFLSMSNKGIQIVAPHSMKEQIIYINHYQCGSSNPCWPVIPEVGLCIKNAKRFLLASSSRRLLRNRANVCTLRMKPVKAKKECHDNSTISSKFLNNFKIIFSMVYSI